jgi:protein tyrosine phosphatase (PTP) superfamily phosphohydrolase (DUF442 family)
MLAVPQYTSLFLGEACELTRFRTAFAPPLTRRAAVAGALAALCITGIAGPGSARSAAGRLETPSTRPPEWAVPIGVEGVPNLHRINRSLYRSAQPKSVGFIGLARNLGIRTVINLRALHSDDPFAQETGLALVRVPIRTWDIRDDRVIEALYQVRRAVERGPVLVHCNHGADRTGLILALYRTLYDGWSKGAAVEEMLHGEFGFHAVWGNIPEFIEKVHVDQLKRLVEMS